MKSEIAQIKQALARDPQDRPALHALARLCAERRDPGVVPLYRLLLTLDPADAAALLGWARWLGRTGDEAGMRAAFDRLAELRPADPLVLLERVYAERRNDRLDAALAAAGRLLERHPDCAIGWVAQGSVRYRAEDYEAAETAFRTALRLEPDLAPAHFALACTLLTQGRWAEGFAEQEWRRRLPERVASPVEVPELGGDEPPGTRVLLWNDQGFGDALQFLRFVPVLAARGYRITLRLQRELLRLAEGLAGIAEVIGPDVPVPAVERQATLDGLPHRLGLADPAASSQAGPYLVPPAALPLPGRRPGLRSGRLAVGLVWAGSPRHENDASRSLDPALLAPLLSARFDIDWYSLQPGARADGLAGHVTDLSPFIGDFADTAGFIASLDLVISVDTAVLHLAGALGRPGWGLLARPADWRWSCTGETSSWYPSLRLFRQPVLGDWASVIAAVAAALAEIRPPV